MRHANDETEVDVILPTRGRTHTLGAAIESVLGQTHARLRLHVIADGCGREVEPVVAGFGDPRLRLHAFPKARGFGYANRNAVLRELAGPCVAYMNDDDLLLYDHLEVALAALDAEPGRAPRARRCPRGSGTRA